MGWTNDSNGERIPTWADLEDFAAEYGCGFWMLDPARLRGNVQHFRDAFVQAGWPETTIAWSYKTSWLPPAVRAAISAGAHSEVVSRHEYELALALGAGPASILFSGHLKTRRDLERAFGLGSRVHLDNLEEVADLLTLARDCPKCNFRVGLRANVDFGQPSRGRFGLDAESGDLQRAFRVLAAEPNVSVNALHLHVSAVRQAESYSRRIRRMVRLASELWPDDDGPEYLDLGGGFTGTVPESLANQLPSPPHTPTEYAAAIVPALLERWSEGGPGLILEPGMALAADTMRFAARVGAVKTISGVRHALVTASIYTVKPTLHSFDMPFHVLRSGHAVPREGMTVVSGWTCMEQDILCRNCRYELERGDWLLFHNCGAYTFVLNPPFIYGTPAVLALAPDGSWTLARRADTVESWISPFKENP
jgi:diaminopimelate decarboxylase